MKMKPFLSLALAAAAFSFTGCDDNDNTNDMGNQNDARVLVVHAVPDAPGVDLRVDNNVVGTNLTFGNNTPYLNAAGGTRNIKVSPTGTQTFVIDANVPLEARVSYTAFATGRATTTPPSVLPIVVTDNLALPASGQAHVRFFHLAPGAQAVDIFTFTGTTAPSAPTFRNRSFETQATATANQNFTPVAAGDYTIDVRGAGTATSVLTVRNVQLQSGKIYTIYARGGSGGQALSAGVITHN